MIVRYLLLLISVFSITIQAADCVSQFPGPQALSINGTSAINNSAMCDGVACAPSTFTEISPIPTISPTGTFNGGTLTAGVYEFTDSGMSFGQTVTFSGTGTAVLYFSSLTLAKEIKINEGGNPENVMIIVLGDLSINKAVKINALIYVAGNASVDGDATIDKDVQLTGALSVAGDLTIAKDSVFNFVPVAVSNVDSQGFCNGVTYPYFTDFDSTNAEWTVADDWSINNVWHNGWQSFSGSQYLDNNAAEVNQQYHRNYYATLNTAVPIPFSANSPTLSFYYQANIFSGQVDLQISTDGTNWATLKTFSDQLNHALYTKHEINLDSYKGSNVQIRFRQYYNGATGARMFTVDNFRIGDLLIPNLGYPYSNDFESLTKREEFNDEGDWNLSTAHDSNWFPQGGSYFLDNNASNENQQYHREHFATLEGYIPLPADSSNVVVSFDYLSNTYSGAVYLQIQPVGATGWTTLKTFDDQLNHTKYARFEQTLSAYGGQSVRFRFRQYWNGSTGARVFAIDNFSVDVQPTIIYNYPYANDYETDVSTPSVNGRDHWNDEGDWGLSTTHDTLYTPHQGSYFLDNNAGNENQQYHREHFVTMKGYLAIPATAVMPIVRFWYQSNVFSGAVYLQVQELGQTTWSTLTTFDDQLNHSQYARYDQSLDSFKGKTIRFRFRQYWNGSTGPRIFTIDDFYVGEFVGDTLAFPYLNDFESAVSTPTINGRDHFNHAGDWGISQSHDSNWFPHNGSYFLDNNADNENQQYHREHFVEMTGFVPIPGGATAPTLSFWYQANIFSGAVYVQLQTEGSNSWTTLKTFDDQLNHASYALYEQNLDSYKGQSIRIRFRQYWNGSTGARVFTVDDFSIAEQSNETYLYPYFNDFETPVSVPGTNGQDHWNHQGDWNVSSAHDTSYAPKNGNVFLDNNADNENQQYHREHFVDLMGFVPVPVTAINPQISFWYFANIFSGAVYLQVQEEGSNSWLTLKTFDDQSNHTSYTQYFYDLDSYKGKSIRVRFRQYWNGSVGPRVFTVDDFRIGDNNSNNLGYPYVNDLETAEVRAHFNHEGDWGISAVHDTNYTPHQGAWFIDNTADYENQQYHREHFITLVDYVPIPAGATLPTLSFWYKANVFSGAVYVQIRRKTDANWTTLRTFDDQSNHENYTQAELNLDAYKGDDIFIRFRQYWNGSTGPRLFVVDDVRIGDFINDNYNFPYFNDFDTAISTVTINGRDQWNDEQDWGIVDQNLVTGAAFSGDWFLDNNPSAENQQYHREHFTTMRGFVPIPSAAVNPRVTFQYQANVFSGNVYLQVQRQGQWTWTTLKTFGTADNTGAYLRYSQSLNSYKGETIRLRFRQYYNGSTGERIFNVDDFAIDQDLLGWWYFEENWLDDGGQGINLTSVNSPTFNNVLRAKDGPALSNTSSCFYTEYASNQYATAIGSDLQSQFEQLTISAWIKPSSYNASSAAIISKSAAFSVMLDSSGHVQWNYGGVQLTSASTVALNAWAHIAVTYKNGEQHIYINGASNATGSQTGALVGLDKDIFVAADFNSATNSPYADRYFNGSIDELRFYRDAQSQAEVVADMDILHPCVVNTAPHHFEIQHDGSGLTCAAEAITIKACNDASCSTLSTDVITLELQGDGVTKATPTFTGSTVVNLRQLTPDILTLGIVNPSIAATDGVLCTGAADNSCDLEFFNAGFVVDINNGNDVKACSDTSFLTIKAVKLADNGISCAPAFTGNQSLDLSFSYQNPNTGTKVPALGGSAMAAAGVLQPRTLVFDGNGQASLSLRYDDAGEISIAVSETISSGVASSAASGEFYPDNLVVVAKNSGGDELNSTTLAATPKQTADVDFSLEVNAYCENNTTLTPNYQPQESTALTLAVQQSAPAVVHGALTVNGIELPATDTATTSWQSVNTTSTSFSGRYNEVGLIKLGAQDGNYLGNVIPSAVFADVGRFVPDHFELSLIANGELVASCGSPAQPSVFAYSGQQSLVAPPNGVIKYDSLTPPKFTITAKSALGNTTKNYTNSYMRLLRNGIDLVVPNEDNLAPGVAPLTKVALNANLSANFGAQPLTEAEGVITYTFNANDNFIYPHTANNQVAPFSPSIKLQLYAIVDQDGITANDSDADPLNGVLVLNPSPFAPDNLKVRFGRLVLENSYGPETADLPQPIKIQYWDGNKFVLATDDNCANYDPSKITKTSGTLNHALTTILGSVGTVVNGQSNKLSLGKTGLGNQGTIGASYNAYDWFKYDWDGDGIHDNNPNAIATFGLFRGNDRIISWREVGN